MVSEHSTQQDRGLDEAATLAVLAGGEGSRMGMPKGLLSIHGEPILAYLLRQIAWPGPTMLVSAPGREHPPGCDKFSVEVTDPQAQGPLRGILTALENLTTPLAVVLTVDMPGVRIEHVRWLIERLAERPQAMGIMCQRAARSDSNVEGEQQVARGSCSPFPSGPGGRRGGCVSGANSADGPHPNPPPEYRRREKILSGTVAIEPFPSVYRREAGGEIAQHLASGRRSVHGLLDRAGFVAIGAPSEWEPHVWVNLNRPRELEAYLKSKDPT
ncbi:MAG TPA: molybdenum cofactor guanylyltransferase [Humisphaera sp.]|jgi:molybdopterin-guanine dinucleotide biosynthesis protein A|nr:molybdenum cofactor guanylyltransferase [Humisphaera sp.]